MNGESRFQERIRCASSSLAVCILYGLFLNALYPVTLYSAEPAFPVRAQRILFLGDSITYAGHYIDRIEAQMRLAGIQPMPELINLGLPSETVSGLSEPTHPFPRPGVHERLDRALKKIHPDVVVVCYGMNDGIYAPFSKERFQAFQSGYDKLIEKVHASGAKLILMTPPPFDPVPLRQQGKLQSADSGEFDWRGIYENYDEEVMTPYADWVLKQNDRVEMVIDLHSAVQQFLDEKRKDDPEFTMSGDGVHLNDAGHRVLAKAILNAWAIPVDPEPSSALLNLVEQRQTTLKHAWLSTVEHKRPGVTAGLPLKEAEAKAAELDQKIQSLPVN